MRHPREVVLTEESRLARGKPRRVQSQERPCLPQDELLACKGCCARQSRGLGAGGGRLSALELATTVWDPGPQHDLCSCFPGPTVGTQHIRQLAKRAAQLSLRQHVQELWRCVSESRSECQY